jgi:hypothetical protein
MSFLNVQYLLTTDVNTATIRLQQGAKTIISA